MKKRRQSVLPAGMPLDVLKLESSQGRCPGGHLLPHKTNRGRCTPVHCAGSASGGAVDGSTTHVKSSEVVKTPGGSSVLAKQKADLLKQLSQRADAVIERLLPGQSPEMQGARTAAQLQKIDELHKIGHAVGRFAARQAVFKTPEGLKGAEAENYFRDEADGMLPDIIVDLKNDLRFGDDSQRREARRDLLDITGKRKQENVQGGHAMIVLVGQNGVGTKLKIPWAKNQTSPLGPVGTGLASVSSASSSTVDALPQGSSAASEDSASEEPQRPTGPKGDSDDA